MNLPAGTRLGRYEIRSKIGEGGMGEVYRAYDPKINREVAIKVLATALSADKDRLARFDQEAQAAGALNHPNILVVHHIDTHDGVPYVVSELLEGETLRERMGGVALPQRKAIDYALQTAHGLAAAHQKGIVHRDLKPDNLFITRDGRVKILDFGLAKLTAASDESPSQTEIPTRRVNTDPGVVMGTIGYMSPEQLRGKPADHRSDIFSFGTILYEMLSGKRAFRGESTADTISAILREDPPDLSTTNKAVNPALERVVNHCLEKNPEERFNSARDLAFAIEALSAPSSHSESTATVLAALPRWKRKPRELIAWVLVALLFVTAAALAVAYFRRTPAAEPITRFVIAIPDGASDISSPVVSPDGRTLAFIATVDNQRSIYVRPFDSLISLRLAGTEEAMYPFWSADSRYMGFFSNNRLKRIGSTGGPTQTLCDAQNPTGGAWNKEGVILFSLENKGIFRVASSGGSPGLVVKLDESRKEAVLSWPVFLPDGRHFLYHSWNGRPDMSGIFVATLDGSERKLLMMNDSNAAYSPPGYLLYARGATVMAQVFDAAKLQLSGEPFPVAEQVTYTAPISYSHFSVSENGVMVSWSARVGTRQLIWFDRTGKELSRVGPPGDYNDVVLSPDEKTAALQNIQGGQSDIWLMDLVRGVPLRFTFNVAEDDDPTWSSDGNSVFFQSNRDGFVGLYQKVSTGAGNEQLLAQTDGVSEGIDCSGDGRFILFVRGGASSGADLWVVPLFGDQKPYPVLQGEFNETLGRFSPDSHWFAYTSNESGRNEVYVQNFPPAGGKWQVSTNGGAQPRWSRDGKQLYYVASDRKLMVVNVTLGSSFQMGTPTALFQTRVFRFNSPNRYAVSNDGHRFLVNSSGEEVNQTPFTVVLNWPASLKKQ
jgi:eukaryotic-like serine/threonine-protein kinase